MQSYSTGNIQPILKEKSIDASYEKTQMLELSDKDFKEAII